MFSILFKVLMEGRKEGQLGRWENGTQGLKTDNNIAQLLRREEN